MGKRKVEALKSQYIRARITKSQGNIVPFKPLTSSKKIGFIEFLDDLLSIHSLARLLSIVTRGQKEPRNDFIPNHNRARIIRLASIHRCLL